MFISCAISLGIADGYKFLSSKIGPNSGPHTLPSDHTSFAFPDATVLYNEFKSSSPFLAYSGYAFAITTGTFRIVNNYHLLSDVLVGAGLGMIVANCVYYFEPLKNFNPFKHTQNISFVPKINSNSYGFYFSYKFKQI